MSNNAPAAVTTPLLTPKCPTGSLGALCMANSTSQGKFSNNPASTIAFAPPKPSSAGWKMKWTRPRKSRFAAKCLAAPSSIVVWPSWPQACITPSARERCAKVFRSWMGSASMSARSPTARVSLPRLSTPTTPVPAIPGMRFNAELAQLGGHEIRSAPLLEGPSSGWA